MRKKIFSKIVFAILIGGVFVTPAMADNDTALRIIRGLRVLNALSKNAQQEQNAEAQEGYTKEAAIARANEIAEQYAEMTPTTDPKAALQEFMNYYKNDGMTASIQENEYNPGNDVLTAYYEDTESYELAVDYTMNTITVTVYYPKVNVSEKVKKDFRTK